ncbi:type IV pilus modification PilV family protein [Vibrio sp. TRT 17S01]|uniref:type IV pilus modification PilV family protein n=1 Tax=Vibrio sp. TRT 17S01 TaxID=3418505 RepID=UPI003CF70CEE
MSPSRCLSKGFTLIESVIVIVVMGLAMITIVSFLQPQIERSANPHYQTRVAALGQSLMTQILAQGFDHNSDFNGGRVRCGETIVGEMVPSCTAANDLGPEESDVLQYNDVDDYHGCWTPEGTGGCGNLNTLLGEAQTTYQNFRVDVVVNYPAGYNAFTIKRVLLTISASNQTPISLTAYKGNY